MLQVNDFIWSNSPLNISVPYNVNPESKGGTDF